MAATINKYHIVGNQIENLAEIPADLGLDICSSRDAGTDLHCTSARVCTREARNDEAGLPIMKGTHVWARAMTAMRH